MDADAITEYIGRQFEKVDVAAACREAGSPEMGWGDTFFMYHRTTTFRSRRL